MNKELTDAKSPSASSTATSEGRFCIKNVIEEEVVGKGALSLASKVHASACKGMSLRRGVGTLKHLSFKCLWVQEARRDERIQAAKIPQDADALVSATDFVKHISHLRLSSVLFSSAFNSLPM